MICSLIQPNLWVGPTPRSEKDFIHLRSLNIPLSLACKMSKIGITRGLSRNGRRRLALVWYSRAFRSKTSIRMN